MTSRFDYIRYNEVTEKSQAEIKKIFREAETSGQIHLDKGPWRDRYMEHLEYAYMCAGKALRDQQIKYNAGAELQEDRGDG